MYYDPGPLSHSGNGAGGARTSRRLGDAVRRVSLMEYRLYWYPGTCARGPYVGLEEIGQPYEAVLVNKLGPPDPGFLALNPKGKVPVLTVGARTITENPAIQTFLARRHPEARLLPTGDAELEIEVLETISWFAAGVHPYVTRLRFPRFFTDRTDAYESIRAVARAQLEECFVILEARLQDRDWLFGDWSLADVHLLWLWFRATGSGMDGTAFPRCIEHAARCEARPSVATVLRHEEEEYARLREAGRVPAGVPDFQAGRSRVFDLV
jgi:glutathione S-transferase